MNMTPQEIRAEVDRLSRLSAWPGCPGGGWQYPFDLGHGITTPTYSPVQAALHPWRRKVLLKNLEPLFAGRFDQISVLDIGSCEGGIAAGLWERGVRNITCVEGRPINAEKARFVNKVKGYGIEVIEGDVTSYLNSETKKYDLVLFMGILYHLLNPFEASKMVAKVTRELAVYETVIAIPEPITFKNVEHYRSTRAGFFVRIDSTLSNTAGFDDLELWPTRAGLDMLLKHSGFQNVEELDYGSSPDPFYAAGERIMVFAKT